MDELLTVPEAAARLGVPQQQVYRWISHGRLTWAIPGKRGAPETAGKLSAGPVDALRQERIAAAERRLQKARGD